MRLALAAPNAEEQIRELVDQGRDASLRIRRRREDETFGRVVHIHVQVDDRIAYCDVDEHFTDYAELVDRQACRVIRYVLDPATAKDAAPAVHNCCPR